jgi:dipeptidyl aminopeptidase/acylaminoacyl peptidase
MPSPIAPDLVYELVSVSSPSLSPDGGRVAFARSKYDRERKEHRSQIMVAELPGGEPRPFTQGAKDGSPRFSPDGGSMAFIRPDDGDRKQLWLIPASGGEARRLTSVAGGVAEFAWSPDGTRIAFASDVDPDVPPDGEESSEPRVSVVRRIRYRYDTLGWRGDTHSHLFVLEVASGEVQQLTDGDWDDHMPAWSLDGARIAFISDRAEDRDVTNRREVYVVAAGGGEPREWSQGLISTLAATWAQDGERLAVLGTDDPEVILPWQGRIFILEPGKPPVALTDGSVSPVGGFPPAPTPDIRWTNDDHVVFLGDSWGESFLYQAPVSGGGAGLVWGGGAQLTDLALDAAAGRAVVVSVPPDSAGDLRVVDLKADSDEQLTSYNLDYFAEHLPGRMEKFTLDRDGTEIESRVVFPPDFDPSRTYPMVLDVHGGPQSAFYDAFNPVQQVLATAGYVVLAVNPRGSSGYGIDFVKAVLRDWGGEDYRDIMATVDEMVGRSYVDETRLGVTGYSYGGYMTSWIVGHETRFKAAVAGAPVTDLSSMYGTSDIGVSFGEIEWGGGRVDALDKFMEMSPLTYVPRVVAPVLLLHGEADLRCPISQSEEYFVALKRLGKEVEMVRFPGGYHSFLRMGHPKLREEYLARTLAWFDRYVGG